jgi:long-chain acyl-CoA synthetase
MEMQENLVGGAIRPRLIVAVPLVIEKIYARRLAPVLERETTRLLMRIPPVRRIFQRKIREKLVAVFGGRFREIVIGGAALNGHVERFLRAIGFPFTCGYGIDEFQKTPTKKIRRFLYSGTA